MPEGIQLGSGCPFPQPRPTLPLWPLHLHHGFLGLILSLYFISVYLLGWATKWSCSAQLFLVLS